MIVFIIARWKDDPFIIKKDKAIFAIHPYY